MSFSSKSSSGIAVILLIASVICYGHFILRQYPTRNQQIVQIGYLKTFVSLRNRFIGISQKKFLPREKILEFKIR